MSLELSHVVSHVVMVGVIDVVSRSLVDQG